MSKLPRPKCWRVTARVGEVRSNVGEGSSVPRGGGGSMGDVGSYLGHNTLLNSLTYFPALLTPFLPPLRPPHQVQYTYAKSSLPHTNCEVVSVVDEVQYIPCLQPGETPPPSHHSALLSVVKLSSK